MKRQGIRVSIIGLAAAIGAGLSSLNPYSLRSVPGSFTPPSRSRKGKKRNNKYRAFSRQHERRNLYIADAQFDSSGNVKRLAPASGTGKHGATGQKWESYAHHDACTRLRLTVEARAREGGAK